MRITPAPNEVAVVRVPAGTSVELPGRRHLPAVEAQTRFITVPGADLRWRRAYETYNRAAGIALGSHLPLRDRAIWQEAARLADQGSRSVPAVLYVVHEQQVSGTGVSVWVAASIRQG